ncbi:CUB and sushi domain-containing protein 3-like [Lineus longissimus]|uniref:CUB and sushi domain-containing protein 3-like n=1 Tax=Lineus longissimus TaxID=88925 RepID=UPI002B4C9F7D
MATSTRCLLSCAMVAVVMFASDCVMLSSNQNQCGGHLTNKTGSITSPGYPEVYPGDSNCEWSIIAGSGLGITIIFEQFQLDAGDTLKIYDNDPTFDSSKPKWPAFTRFVQAGTVYSTHFNRLWLVFTSDSETLSMKAKFRIGYLLAKTQCPDVVAPKNGSRTFGDSVRGYTVTFSCDAGYILQGNSTLTCLVGGPEGGQWPGMPPQCVAPCYSGSSVAQNGLGYFTVPSNNPILSPKYPSPLGNPGKCIWKVQVKSGLYVNLTATDFNLDRFSGLEIWDRSVGGSLIGNYSGNSFPKFITSRGYTVFISLFSNGPSVGRFSLRFDISNSTNCAPPANAENMYITPVKSTYDLGDRVMYKCVSGFVLAPKNSHNTKTKCSVGKRWTVVSLPKCVAYCKEWDPDDLTFRDVVYRNESGVLYSPGYPGPLIKGSCEYRIAVARGRLIEFDLNKVTLDAFTKIKLYSGVSTQNRTLLMTLATKDLNKIKTFKLTTSNAFVVIEKSSGESFEKFSIRYWSTTSGECEKPVLEYGYMSPVTSGFPDSTVVRFTCEPFFQLHGAAEVVCVAGGMKSRWDPALPSCLSRCGGTYPLLSNGSITSPSISKITRNQCVWNINDPSPAENQISYSISIVMDVLELAPDDILKIQPIGGQVEVIRNKKNLVIVASSAGFMLTFVSSEISTQGRKFRLTYQSNVFVPKPCPMPPSSGYLWIPDGNANPGSTVSFRCKPPYDLVGAEKSTCSKEASVWSPPLPVCSLYCGMAGGGNFIRNASNGGAVANPGYPNMLLGRQTCRWVIQADPGQWITASFSYLDFPKDHKDITIQIFDGAHVGHQKPLLVETEYGVLPSNVTSLTGALTIDYTSTHDDIRENKGFYIRYGVVPSEHRVLMTTRAVPTATSRSSTTPSVATSTERPTVLVHTLSRKPTETTTSPHDHQLDKRVGKVENHAPRGTNTGAIIGAGVACVCLIVAGLVVGGYYWYRRRHPVRMLVGQRFPKFHNPLYETQQPTSSTFSLDKDFNLSSTSSTSLA